MRAAILALVLTLPTAAAAQDASTDAQAQSGQPPQRIRSVTLTGAEACPASTETEVVVCSRLNPEEQYRIPPAFRDDGTIPANRQSWVNRTQTADQVGRVAGGLPNTCSAIGTGGQTGCTQEMLQQWARERRENGESTGVIPR